MHAADLVPSFRSTHACSPGFMPLPTPPMVPWVKNLVKKRNARTNKVKQSGGKYEEQKPCFII